MTSSASSAKTTTTLSLSKMTTSHTAPPLSYGPRDVLCGRGGLSHHHPGNRMYRRLINANRELYHNCIKTSHKHHLVSSIILAIQKMGGRFVRKQQQPLRRGPKGTASSSNRNAKAKWVEITHREAHAKTCQALREQEYLTDGGSPLSRTPSFPSIDSRTLSFSTSTYTSKSMEVLRLRQRQLLQEQLIRTEHHPHHQHQNQQYHQALMSRVMNVPIHSVGNSMEVLALVAGQVQTHN